jgi:o-succinylbenzoate synthase
MAALAVRVIPVGGTVAGAVGTARAKQRTRRGLVVSLEERGGGVGIGEASPLPGRSRESLADVDMALRALDGDTVARAADALTEAPLADIGALLGELPLFSRLPSAARFAVETALLDLVGRRRSLPIALLLGARPDAVVGLQRVVDAGATEVLSAAQEAIADGSGVLKLKLGGGDLRRELAAIAAVREAFPSLTLRLDANRALSTAEVRAHARLLSAAAFVEEPAREGIAAAAECGVRVAADESLSDAPEDVRTLLAAHRLAAIVVKPAEVGGVAAALEWARRAADAKADVVVSHLWDGPIALTMAAHLALALAPPVDEPRAVAGLAPHAALAAWPDVALPLHREHPLRISLVDATPGLGCAQRFSGSAAPFDSA